MKNENELTAALATIEKLRSELDMLAAENVRAEAIRTGLHRGFVPAPRWGRQMTDNVNHPSHYTQGGVECINAITAATVNKTGIEAVCTANVIKYLWRYESKNGLEDVKKAQWYINRLLAELEGKPAVTPDNFGEQA